MLYVVVYDHKGEAFHVPEHVATELRLEHGWSTHPHESPVAVPVEEEEVPVASTWRSRKKSESEETETDK